MRLRFARYIVSASYRMITKILISLPICFFFFQFLFIVWSRHISIRRFIALLVNYVRCQISILHHPLLFSTTDPKYVKLLTTSTSSISWINQVLIIFRSIDCYHNFSFIPVILRSLVLNSSAIFSVLVAMCVMSSAYRRFDIFLSPWRIHLYIFLLFLFHHHIIVSTLLIM